MVQLLLLQDQAETGWTRTGVRQRSREKRVDHSSQPTVSGSPGNPPQKRGSSPSRQLEEKRERHCQQGYRQTLKTGSPLLSFSSRAGRNFVRRRAVEAPPLKLPTDSSGSAPTSLFV
ncbi:hypothetical protein B9Z55_002908 [Caenorhabditis nigoni]|uniref:Uncharacterized protein n=1 Tax=Caenorhabditis nigoni TaxID=1611254 RepID=A0A2G5VMZ8_9PELO|nr:hypothetical protein B9Z55_002908 [Caenorhabditis nigoni]